MISLSAVKVPLTSPTVARIIMMPFLMIITAFSSPFVVFQKTHVCINAGKANPKADFKKKSIKLIWLKSWLCGAFYQIW